MAPITVLEALDWASEKPRKMKGLLSSCLLLAVLAAGCRDDLPEVSLRENSMLSGLAAEYCSQRVRFYPLEAALKGDQEYEGQLGRFDPDAIRGRLSWLQDFRQRLLGVDVTSLSRPSYLDLLLLTSAVKAEMFELAELERWNVSPLYYTSSIFVGLTRLLHSTTQSDDKVDSLVSLLEEVPAFIETARGNLEDPPHLFVEEGIADLRRCRRWIEEMPDLVRSLSPQRLSEFELRSREAARALQELTAYLESEVLPAASSSFAFGPEKLGRLLLYHEMEGEPLDNLRAHAEEDIRATRARMIEVAALVDTPLSPSTALSEPIKEHIQSSAVVPFAKEVLRGLKEFTAEHRLTSPYSVDRLQSMEALAPLRGDGPWFLHIPWLSDLDATRTFFMLNAPRSEWPFPWLEGQPRPLNHRKLRLEMIREIFPGKYLHDLFLKQSNNRLRKLLVSKALREGWGLYIESVLLDKGYEANDPLLLMEHLHRSLIEDCRLVATIDLHARGKSLSATAQFFRDMAYLDAESALQEARAVAVDPTRWSAALGRWQILGLRGEYTVTHGDTPKETLRNFHDGLLSAAGLPLRLVRIKLLH